MQKHRLYIKKLIIPNAELLIENSKAHYLKQVLRLKKNNLITIFDGSGHEYQAEIKELLKNKVLVITGSSKFFEHEAKRKICIGQSLIKKEKMDMLLQKTTELGVNQISPLISEYTVVKLKERRLDNKIEHWEKIIQSACEQSERNILPTLDDPETIEKFILDSPKENYRLILEPGASMTINDINPMDKNIDALIGPEGGFSDSEIKLASKEGFLSVSMGPRILRAETAAITTIAILQSQWGDLGADFRTRKR